MFKCRVWSLGGLLAAGLAIGVVPVQAAPITTYSTVAAWTTAAGGSVTVEDFADATLVTGLAIDFGNFLPPNNISGGVWNDTGLASINNDADAPKVTFSPGTTAWGADFDLTAFGVGSGLSVNLHFTDGTTNVFNILNTSSTQAFVGFVGVVSSVAIDSFFVEALSLTGNGESFTADNLRFVSGPANPGGGDGGGTQVPEPSSLALLGTGLCTMFGRAIRRNRQ